MKHFFSSILSRLRKSGFAGDRGGNVIMIFGLMVVPVMLSIGAAIDYGRAAQTRTSLQTTVDSAAIAAGAAMLNAGNPTQSATNYVQQRFAYTGRTVTTTTTVDANAGTVTVRASTTQPTAVMKIARVDSLPVVASATASIGAGGNKKTELVIAFDTTGSMSQGGRLTTAKQAAKDLVDKVMKLPSGATNPNVKVGFVPFTRYVNVGVSYKGADWLTNSQDYTETLPQTCYNTYPNIVYGPPYRVCQNCDADGVSYDCSYDTADVVSWGSPVNVCYTPTYDHKWYGCVGSQASPADENDLANAANKVPALYDSTDCPSPLIRLGNDQSAINNAIDAMNASGETYIAPGLLWGWRLLSPNPPFGDGLGSGAASKILVLMTDGANTYGASYPDHNSNDVSASDAKLVKVCTAAKAAGITLYTIAFQVTDSKIQNILSQCASGVPYYYNAQTNAELQAAFTAIGAQLTNLRLVK
jgi:Flp pilus assembly protein TadG